MAKNPKIPENRFNRRRPFGRGFTLVEMIVSVALFGIVMLVAVGALLSVVAANRQSQAIKTVINNLNFALESMSRNIRTGSNYRCPSGSTCVVGEPVSAVLFADSNGVDVTYRLNNKTIEQSYGAGFLPITASPSIVVNRLNFYIYGNGVGGDRSYPRVLVSVGGLANVGKSQSNFDIETIISQRSSN
jgi:prepilin-type N-terminal cleavage/methylation domain-containing protein